MPESPSSSSADQPISRPSAARLGAQVYALVRACPPGRVTTYGWIGAALGYPRGARMVGWFMNRSHSGDGVPAQRVVNSKGELTGSWAFGQRGRMRELLEREGVVFSAEGKIDLKRFGWDPRRDLSADELDAILKGADTTPAEVDDDLLRLLMDDPASPFRIQPTGR
ncbi:MAG TPA: MGMT family protein [Ktedonobacterales bacterium]|nr:MGMT family protein [Ktedonobacterales bacterium]